MADLRDKLFLNRCVANGLFAQQQAERIHRQAVLEDRRATDLLVEHGLMTRQEVERLLGGLGAEDVPRSIGGFRILHVIGSGGMGTVYLAEQESLGRQVAIKLIAAKAAQDPDLVERFLREARLTARINHPHVVGIIDAGRHAGRPYLVMELVGGGDAARLMKRAGGRLDERRALELIADCCTGLAALAAARLLHRDLKPANILIDEDGRAKLGDLGLARSQSDDERLTTTGITVGTPAFMSPEQALADATLDVRSDLYALGATLYTLLTGREPYAGSSAAEVAALVLTRAFPDPLALRPELSPATAALIRKATARLPADRHQTPTALLDAIDAALATL
jgi:serine/threonine-protein kinase